MINLLSSGAGNPSEDFVEVERPEGQDNLTWLKRNLKPGDDHTALVMLGGTTPTSFRLRLAQAHVRTDLSPSYWSHIVLAGRFAKNLGSTRIYEMSLEPQKGFGFPVPENGVQEGRLKEYADPKEYPNIALLKVPVKFKDVKKSLDRFKMQRAVLDGVDLIVRWLAYLWGVARSPNPLLDGQGIPSAAMLEIVVGACGFDLTPGLESRSSCPEAIWQAARWWHEYYEKQEKQKLTGAYYARNEITTSYVEPKKRKRKS